MESTGVRWETPVHGSLGADVVGDKFQKISLNYPDEYLKQVVGTNKGFLNSISFVTNKKAYGPFENPKGEKFQSPADQVVVGFFGRSGLLISQLGVLTTVDGRQLEKAAKDAVVAQGSWAGLLGGTFCDVEATL